MKITTKSALVLQIIQLKRQIVDQALVNDTGRYSAFWVSMFILCRCSTSMLDMEVWKYIQKYSICDVFFLSKIIYWTIWRTCSGILKSSLVYVSILKWTSMLNIDIKCTITPSIVDKYIFLWFINWKFEINKSDQWS